MKKYIVLLIAVIAAVISALPTGAFANMGIANTKHNLSVSGPGELKGLTETRICVFCHTPHNAAPRTPLWNRDIQEGIIYVPYTSTTMGATVSQPTGPSRLCLSCHDGTLALGAVLRPAEGIEMTGEITPDRPSYIGTNLTNHHPVSFSYYDSLPNPELEPFLPEGIIFYGSGYIHCSTCHDAHDDTYGKFLVMDNRYSALCTACHKKTGWDLSTHKTSGIALPGPLPGKDWTGWSTVAEYGCESCHVPHTAGGARRILIYSKEEDNCYQCHDGTVALKNIQSQFQSKLSTHPVEATTGLHEPNETELSPFVTGHVECADCHNPHIANNRQGDPPLVSGKLDGVSGVTLSGAGVSSATYEYEICFKCHSDTNPSVFLPVLRVINENNARYEFNTLNPSFHPVTGIGPNQNVPSLSPPSPDPEAPQGLSASSRIYCSDCHSDDSGVSRGPHGSSYAPILRDNYETLDYTPESYQHYALCYRCHNRTSILNDESFKEHNKHIVEERTPCSVCHDPHGIPDNGLSGSHTHLINFDTNVVLPASGKQFPEFTDTGTFSGGCTLRCHGEDHNAIDERYPD